MAQQKWEYAVIEISPNSKPMSARLDDMGEKGWELVAVAVQFTSHFAYFKRRAT